MKSATCHGAFDRPGAGGSRADLKREIGDIALRGSRASAGAGWLRPKSVVQDSEPDRSHRLVLRDGREVALRAITEADAPAIQRAFDDLSTESRYSRFLHHKKHLDPTALARGIHPRPGQDCVLVATVPQRLGIEIVGGAQYVRASPSDDATCEFAITVAEDWRGCGLARELLAALLNRARRDHYVAMVGLVLAANAPMLALAHRLQFSAEPLSDGQNLVQVTRQLERRTARSASAMMAHHLKRVLSGLLPWLALQQM